MDLFKTGAFETHPGPGLLNRERNHSTNQLRFIHSSISLTSLQYAAGRFSAENFGEPALKILIRTEDKSTSQWLVQLSEIRLQPISLWPSNAIHSFVSLLTD